MKEERDWREAKGEREEATHRYILVLYLVFQHPLRVTGEVHK